MSMICWVLGLTLTQIGALRATPSLTRKLTSVAMDDQYQAQIDEAIRRMSPEQKQRFEASRSDTRPAVKEWQARLAEARERIAPLNPFETALGVEKSWHMLHYLFTGHLGTTRAPGDLLLTGEEVGEDVGYGPARLHGPTETREFGRFLETQDLARLQERVSLQEMNRLRVYGMPMGAGSDAEHEKGLRDDVGFYFPRLRDYMGRMSDKGNGLLVWVS
jgi:Domain of unknown function (DUF1877)